MEKSIHYLLMADHFIFQKTLFANVKSDGLTMGQPKVLDYLKDHDGMMQKEIASACHIEPASLTSVLNGMEKKGLISREMRGGNRRSLYVCLTDKGRRQAGRIRDEFKKIEGTAMEGFSPEEEEKLRGYLLRIYQNMYREK